MSKKINVGSFFFKYELYEASIDAAAHSEHGILIRFDF
jgi:hypothetical protein